MPPFSDREQTIVQTILLNLFAKGFMHDEGTELAMPEDVLQLLGKQATREALLRLLDCGAGRSNGRDRRHVRWPAAVVDPRLVRAIKYLQARCGDPRLSLADIALQSRLSKWHFDRLLTSTTGTGFRGHLRMARMARARSLLGTSTLTIKEIAASVGYTHTSQFSRHFKSRFGITATAYRQRNHR
jgi:transcriptional regulator GlxA family with amidase domain